MTGLRSGAQALTLGLALALILLPSLRDVQGLRWGYMVTYLVVMGYEVLHGYREGHLSVPLSELPRRRLKTSGLELLAAVCGTIALMLVL